MTSAVFTVLERADKGKELALFVGADETRNVIAVAKWGWVRIPFHYQKYYNLFSFWEDISIVIQQILLTSITIINI